MSTLAEIRTPDGAWSLEAEDGALWLHYVVGGKRTVVPVTKAVLMRFATAAVAMNPCVRVLA